MSDLPIKAENSNPTGRRQFLQTAAVAAIATALPRAWGAAASQPATAIAPPGRSVLFGNKQTRLSIAMWDYSWLCDSAPGGAFADLERCVAGARERGFNTLRVDAFISQQLQPETRFEKNWTGGLPQWGMTRSTFSCNVRKRVAELARLCRKHEVWLGLDSWKSLPDYKLAASEGQLLDVFDSFGRMWALALRGMREDGVLEQAVWVAPLNEVPWHGSRIPAVKKISTEPVHEGLTRFQKTQALDALYRKMNHAMAEPIHVELAKDQIPISYSSLSAENYAARVSDLYDVVDLHFMPSVLTDATDVASLERAGKGLSVLAPFASYKNADLKQFSSAWDVACRKHYDAMLRRAYTFFQAALDRLVLPSGKHLQAVVTESFGPCFWPVVPEVNQQWYKRYNGDALRTIAALPISGSSVSNYAEPLYPAIWDDVDWLWTANQYFAAQTDVAEQAQAARGF